MDKLNINIGFLVNANYKIGAGNVVRCMNLANYLKKNQNIQKIIFFSQKNDYTDVLIKKNYFILKSIPLSIENCIEYINKELNELLIRIFIIDVPNIEPDIIKQIQNPNILFVILDTSYQELIQSNNLIINILPRLTITSRNSKQIHQGIRFWILNPTFLEKNISYQISKDANNIMISLGTTDPIHLTKKICLALENRFNECNFKLIIGPGFQNKQFFKDFCEKNKNFQYIENPENLLELMVKSDIALSAGGGTTFELIFVGIPSIILPNGIDNLQLSKTLKKKKLILSINEILEFNDNELIKKLERLRVNYKLRKNLSNKCKKFFRGDGCALIEEKILNYYKLMYNK